MQALASRSLLGPSDHALPQELRPLVAKERAATIAVVLHIAEVERRKLYRRAGYERMYLYCMHELHISESAAYKRVHAGRAARRYPVVLAALESGRLHLSGLIELVPYLNAENAEELVAASVHKSSNEIERMLAGRFPKPPAKTRFTTLAVLPPTTAPQPDAGSQPASGGTPEMTPETPNSLRIQLSSRRVFEPPAPPAGTLPDAAEPAPGGEPAAEEWIRITTTVSGGTRDKLRRAAELLSHEIPSGDIPEVLDRVLDLAIAQLEKLKHAATDSPRPARASTDPRHVPAATERLVRERDGHQCVQCGSRWQLEIDHILPLARGGTSEPSNLRLLCRGCNQEAAERLFGAPFVNGKREPDARWSKCATGVTRRVWRARGT